MIQEDPARQVQQALINEMRLRPPCGIDPSQIRAKLDTSGEMKGFSGITVSVSDLGGHDGLPGRILVDVKDHQSKAILRGDGSTSTPCSS